MRKLVIGMALASTAIAAPALAKDNAWYVGGEFGGMIVKDMDFDVLDANENTIDTLGIETDPGYDGGLFVGYDFGGFRLEAEASYRNADLEKATVGATGLPNGTFVVPAGTRYFSDGDLGILSFMLNGLFDFGPDDGLSGYVGGGVGVARTKLDGTTFFDAAAPSIDDSDSGFAWQLLAGVNTPISDNIDLGLRYRYFNAVDVDLVTLGGRQIEDTIKTHSLMGTLTFNFGEPPVVAPVPVPAPPPPPVPVPVPPPPPPACQSGPYIVFFDWDKSDITPEAATVLDNAVSAYANCGTASVMLAGHTDKSGSNAYNMGLAERRNTSVRSYLTGRGIPDGRISSQAFGEEQPRVPTADGVRELQNRRVEVTYGPGSGM